MTGKSALRLLRYTLYMAVLLFGGGEGTRAPTLRDDLWRGGRMHSGSYMLTRLIGCPPPRDVAGGGVNVLHLSIRRVGEAAQPRGENNHYIHPFTSPSLCPLVLLTCHFSRAHTFSRPVVSSFQVFPFHLLFDPKRHFTSCFELFGR